MQGHHRAGSRTTSPGRHRGDRQPWRPPAALSSVAGAAAATTVVVAVGPALLSGTGNPAVATPSESGSSVHGAAAVGNGRAEPTSALSRPPFTGERRADRSGGRHRAPGPADPDLQPGGAAAPVGAPAPTSGPSAAPAPTTTSGGDTAAGGGGSGDGGAGGGSAGGVQVGVDDDGVSVDSDLTGPVEVPLPTPLPDLGL